MKNCYFCKNFIYRVTNVEEMNFMCLCKTRNSETMQGWLDEGMDISVNFECCDFDDEKLKDIDDI